MVIGDGKTAETQTGATDLETPEDVRVWPFHTSAEAMKAAEMCFSGKVVPLQKRKIISRLAITYEFAAAFAPLFAAQLQLESVSVKHEYFNVFTAMLEHGVDLSGIADDIARQMSDANFALREKAAGILVRMGAGAQSATPRVIGLLRSKMPDVRVNSLRVLTAIGPVCSQAALPKIAMMIRGNQPPEVLEAVENALRELSGRESESPDETPPVGKDESQYKNIKGRRVLVVDDNALLCGIIEDLLVSNGALVTTANDEPGILRALEKEYDIALVDLFLEDTNGIEIIRKIRQHPLMNSLPIYVISAAQDKRIMLALAKFDICGYIVKPFAADDLLGHVNSTLAPKG